MDNPQQTLTDAEKGWLAGILDGEGSILLFLGVKKGGKLNNVSPQVTVGNTEKEMIEQYASLLKKIPAGVHVSSRVPKCGGIKSTMTPKRAEKYKRLYVASSVGFSRVKSVLKVVTPYLVTSKKKKAELILEYINYRFSQGVTTNAKTGAKYCKIPYTDTDYKMMLEILAMQHSKHTPIVKGLLRDYTREQGLQCSV
jgi:hypothetical protein